MNRNLVVDLQKLGIWDSTREAILRSRRATSRTSTRSRTTSRPSYKTSFQLSPYSFLEVAARAQKWIDQSISRNMYLETRDLGDMMDIYFAAWERGVKTTYYLHMKPRHTAEQSTVKVNKAEDIDARRRRRRARPAAAAAVRCARASWLRRPRTEGGCLMDRTSTTSASTTFRSIRWTTCSARAASTMGILGTGLQEGLLLKPIRYQWAMDLYDQAVANTWFPNEIQLGEDIADFKKMTDEERHAVTFLMRYFNPNELLVNKALAFGVYPYVNAAERSLYLAKQMWEEANHCMSFEYVLETFPIDRKEAYNSHVDIPSMARKEEFEVKFIRRMTEQTLDITTTEGKQDFVRNLVAYNVILEGIWFYSGFMVALSFRQRNLLRNFGSLMDWVVRDESLHLKFGINLILTVLEENPDLQTDGVRRRDQADDHWTPSRWRSSTTTTCSRAASSASTPTTSTSTSSTWPTAGSRSSASSPSTT